MRKRSLNDYLILIAAMLIMFLPRRIYIAGIFSFRAIILLVFLLYIFNHKSIRIPRVLRSLPVLLYLLYTFLNYFLTSQITSGIGFLVDTFVLICIIVSIIRDKKDFFYFLDCFIAMLTIYDLLGIIETVTSFNIYDMISGSSAISSVRFGLTRFCGAGLVSSNNANFLLLASILVLYRILHCDDNKKKRKLIAVYVLNAASLCCTLTRAPILLFFALQFVWLIKAGLFRFIRRYFLKITVTILAVFVVIAFVPQVNTVVMSFFSMFQALVNSATADSISDTFGSNAQGTGERLQLYTWVNQQIKGSEIFGKGANTPFIQEWVTSYGKRVIKNSLENHYLMVYFQFGLVGLVTFILHYLYFLFHVGKAGMRCKRINSMAVRGGWNFCTMVFWGIIIMIPAMFVTGLFDELRMLYLMIALAAAYEKFGIDELRIL